MLTLDSLLTDAISTSPLVAFRQTALEVRVGHHFVSFASW